MGRKRKDNRLELFWNEINYGSWLIDNKIDAFVFRHAGRLFSAIVDRVASAERKKRYQEGMSKFDGTHGYNGYEPIMRDPIYWYGFFLGSVIFGLITRVIGEVNWGAYLLIHIIIFGINCFLDHIFIDSNKKYLKYYRRFVKKDEQWNKNLIRKTVLFYVFAPISLFLGCAITLAALIL